MSDDPERELHKRAAMRRELRARVAELLTRERGVVLSEAFKLADQVIATMPDNQLEAMYHRHREERPGWPLMLRAMGEPLEEDEEE